MNDRPDHSFAIIAWITKGVKNKPYGIIETYPCCDGLRSRICDGRFATTAEAENMIKSHEKFVNGAKP